EDPSMTAARAWAALLAVMLLFCGRVARAECVETGPSTGERPTLVDSFPDRGLSGYTATLHVVVTHGKGETVLPRGLEPAGWPLPDQDGGSGARLASADDAKNAARRQTTLDLPLVALPSGPG